MAGVRPLSILFALSMLVVAACGGGGGSSSSPPEENGPQEVQALKARFAIDGTVDFSVFEQTFERDVLFTHTVTGQTREGTLRYAFLNDDRHLYAAFEWQDPTLNNDFELIVGPTDFDAITLQLYNPGSGGEDTKSIVSALSSSQYVDQRGDSDEDDTVGDGFGRLRYRQNEAVYTAEFLVPLANDTHGEDIRISSETLFNVVLIDAFVTGEGAGSAAYLFEPGDQSSWRELALDDVIAEHPELPTNLSGLIAFLSHHEVPNGAIYTFDPATRVTKRVSDAPQLWKDTLSLSHDRTRIAFMGSEDEADFESYEIYILDIASGNITQVTDNNVADGHPAFSLNDSRLMYSTFRDPTGASLVIADLEGNELIDLTPDGVGDNDGEFLADGRIVFKTDRFQPEPTVTLAVINEDGSGVFQLTDKMGVSDHDPVGNTRTVLFERFTKDTAYFEDPDSGFVGWDLIAVDVDSLEETILLADGWINWLPVFSPDGNHIVHLKGVGAYTDAQLMTRDGEELGRLIPNATRMDYIDWK